MIIPRAKEPLRLNSNDDVEDEDAYLEDENDSETFILDDYTCFSNISRSRAISAACADRSDPSSSRNRRTYTQLAEIYSRDI